jgi:erythromycin esterase-like protein
MASSTPIYATLDDWIARESIPFALDAPGTFRAAIDRVLASLGNVVELLGLGEALHGGEDILILRNRLFQYLVEAHGYSAIAVESSFPQSRLVDEFAAGHGPAAYEAVQDAGWSHGFGRLDANRELVEWMRRYNADPSHGVKLRFYGFDSPTEMTGTESPRRVLQLVLDYLAAIDHAGAQEYDRRIAPLLGQDFDWENPGAAFDPAQAIGRSPAAVALRNETEDLIAELSARRPELVAKSGRSRYLEAMHYARMARQLLSYHAGLARASGDRTARLLGMRDAMMAENLAYIVSRERGRGKVLAFAHNSHLQRGQARWQLGGDLLTWWPAGAQLQEMLGSRYAVIGSALGVSDANGIRQPEAGTLEARMTAPAGPARFIPTHKGQGLPTSELVHLPTRSGSRKNTTYFVLTPRSLADFDWLAVLDATAYSRGGPQLQEWDGDSRQ